MLINFHFFFSSFFTLSWNESKMKSKSTGKLNPKRNKNLNVQTHLRPHLYRKRLNRILRINVSTFVKRALYLPCTHSGHTFIGFESHRWREQEGTKLIHLFNICKNKYKFFLSSIICTQVHFKKQIEFLIEKSWRWESQRMMMIFFFPPSCFFSFSSILGCEVWNETNTAQTDFTTHKCTNSIYGTQRAT